VKGAIDLASSRYAKYVIDQPEFITEMAHHDFTDISGFTFPDEVYLNGQMLPEAKHWLDLMWIWEVPSPPDLLGAHSHPFAEIVLFVGSNPRDMRDFGGELEWWMGEGDEAERFFIDKTTLIYVPAGLRHGPMNFLRVDRPILNVAIGLETGDYS
jgi:hypothetical protein